jgi:mannose-6-phosphate isomerase-like protein (cupin superfamily)
MRRNKHQHQAFKRKPGREQTTLDAAFVAAHPERTTSMQDSTMRSDDSGEWVLTRPGERCAVRVSADQTNGAYSVAEIVAEPGYSTSVHIHQNEDEHFIVVEGVARFMFGGKTFDAHAGSSVSLERNLPHAWGNPGDTPLRLVVTCTPGGLESILKVPADTDPVEMMQIVEKFGIRSIGPRLIDPE